VSIDAFFDNLVRGDVSPITAASIRVGVAGQPTAAKVLVDLLAGIDLRDPQRGLEQESLAYAELQRSEAHARWLSSRPRAQTPESPGKVIIERFINCVELTLDRPNARNAIDRAMRDDLFDGFLVAALDPDVSRVHLRGRGRAFCVGADLNEFGTTRDPAVAHAIRMETLPARAIVECCRKFSAHVQGPCIGAGLEMVAFTTRLTATRGAWFQLPELSMGLIPGAGGCVSVSRRIGRRRTAALVLSGRRISAQTALCWGLIDAIVDDLAVDHSQPDVFG